MQQKLDEGFSLRQLSKWTYSEREKGKDIPYMSVANVEHTTVTMLYAQPTKKQKTLFAFFDERCEGSKLPKYQLRIDLDKVEFWVTHPKGSECRFENLMDGEKKNCLD